MDLKKKKLKLQFLIKTVEYIAHKSLMCLKQAQLETVKFTMLMLGVTIMMVKDKLFFFANALQK